MEFEIQDKFFCRICMQNDILLDWNEDLFDSCEMSFKDCYYKYTQMAVIDPDPYPQYVCKSCSMDLQNFHLFMLRAIETQIFLEENYEHFNENIPPEEESNFSEPDFDSVLNEDILTEEEYMPQSTECIYLVENVSENEAVEPIVEKVFKKTSKLKIRKDLKCPTRKKIATTKSMDNNVIVDMDTKIKNNTGKKSVKIMGKIQNNKTETTAAKSMRNPAEQEKVELEDNNQEQAKSNITEQPRFKCPYCSKFVRNLRKHEQTHKEDRVRKGMCSVCGLRTFDKHGLNEHMKIHQKTREKKFKCEFCDKAFFNRGACNVHRRIHLGQMVKCALCPKEYYRQIDLDRHMLSHSSEEYKPSNVRTKIKYTVHCKICDKQIRSATFNAHRAAHLNDPMMRCTVCEKDFFSRVSCTKHMKKVHKRTKDGYDDIVMYYDKHRPRLSHVLMEQMQEVQSEPVS